MKSVPLTAYARTSKGRRVSKKLRSDGRIPAVIYGDQGPAQTLEVKSRDLKSLIHHSVSEHLLVDLSVEGEPKPRLVLVQEVQHNNLSGDVLHVDFHEVSATKKVTMTIPVETVGEPVGVKTGGGTLEHVLFNIRVTALPRDLPEFLQIDVTNLELGQSIQVGDIPPIEGVEILGDKGITVASVAVPRSETVEEAGGPTEPEVLSEKKEEAAKESAK